MDARKEIVTIVKPSDSTGKSAVLGGRVGRLQRELYDLYNEASWVLPSDQARMLLRAARMLASFGIELEMRHDRQSQLPLRMPKSAVTPDGGDLAGEGAGDRD